MAEFYSDSHGERWGVMKQEKPMSCGLASAAMTEVYLKSQVQASMEGTFRAISQRFPGNFKEEDGTSMDNVAEILKSRGVHCYDNHNYGGGGVWPYLYAYASDRSPAICCISWGKGRGAHATVCIQVYKSDQKCVFLDPGYGLVEFSGSQLPYYTVADSAGNVKARGTLTGEMILTRKAG